MSNRKVIAAGYTIDAPHSKDLDDAVRVSSHDGGWLVQVWITDVAKYVEKGSETDQLARAMASTRYYAGGSKHMLPWKLAERKLSLLQDKTRSCIEIRVDLNPAGDVLGTELLLTKFRNVRRLSHADIQVIRDDPTQNDHREVMSMIALANQLLMKRRAAGALVIFDLAKGIIADEEGNLVRLPTREDTIGYVVVQELMILANRAMAEFCVKLDIPVIYRNHSVRSAAPPRTALVEELGKVLEFGVESDLPGRAAMFFEPATYDGHVTGHWGLNVPAYMHGTSPIRRYADLVSQRQIRHYLLFHEHLPGFPKSDLISFPCNATEVAFIATELTEKIADAKATRAKGFKSRANAKAADRLHSVGKLVALPDKDFERALKVVLRPGLAEAPVIDAFLEALERRLCDDRVPDAALTAIATDGPAAMESEHWTIEAGDRLTQLFAAKLREQPYRATTIALQGSQRGSWSIPVPDVTASDLGFEASFEGLTAHAPSKKLAVQRLYTAWILMRLGLSQPVAEEGSNGVPVPKPSANPIGALNEWLQAAHRPLAEFTYEKRGTNHAPVFACTATAGGQSATTEAAAKRAAKRTAAEKLLRVLGETG